MHAARYFFASKGYLPNPDELILGPLLPGDTEDQLPSIDFDDPGF